jgi:hemerythrin
LDSFQWGDHFFTGIEDIDAQHHVLVDLINHLGDLLSKVDRVNDADTEAVVKELTAYSQYHFSNEESMMEQVGLDAQHIAQHKQFHLDFLNEVTQLKNVTGDHAAENLLKFLTYWLAYHILGTDQSMARQVAAISSGLSPRAAFDAEKIAKEGATEPLLLALNGLFHQVSERNHQLQELNHTLETKVEERTRSLSEANHLLEQMALIDVLTGLPNRRHAMAWLTRVWGQSTQTLAPLSCMMIDADGFKQVNDNHGHDAGDEVLKQLARQLRQLVRTDDVVCRLGGDEFLIICTDTALDGALTVARKMRESVAKLKVPVTGGGIWPGSVSVGVAQRTTDMQCIEDLIKAADAGLYQAKRNGRNRVEVAPQWFRV